MTRSSMQLRLLAALMMLVGLSVVVTQTQAQCPTSGLAACEPAARSDVQPTDTCCTELQAYLDTNTPEACLCEAAAALIGEDVQYAILIPEKCNLVYKADITCNGIGIPGGY
uniref:Bifunctional inhibitor/plant lipid transfer protein/seed storage helical domain-containing protein n=1 Tax=Physcomitrium patens TaxID=3218 RepID=A0A2K1INB2_PHYPA|nr:uncharacterized protein LOC112274952 [Physcomitrium patens]PNR30763.1 hypothetical protein PHYPA_027079 [Physcomitrium patens]|eukprot:XP_024360603.1 uncharacterized protein LOC112274952 [Physcomitrella patens]